MNALAKARVNLREKSEKRSVEGATDDDTLYVATYSHRIQKLEIDWDNTQVNLIASLGKYGTGKNESNAK